jgi:hypothetical protein
MAARHVALQLLPAVAARGVIVLEGPHDRAGLQAAAERRLRMDIPLPAGQRVALADAGAIDASGGSSATPRLCEAARQLGFFTVAVIDGDPNDQAIINANLTAADAVVRLPDGMAIERALLDGLADEVIHKALGQLAVQLPADHDAARKLIYLALVNAVPQWTRTRNWTTALLAFKIHFGDRLPDTAN